MTGIHEKLTELRESYLELNSVTTRQNEYIFHVCLPNA